MMPFDERPRPKILPDTPAGEPMSDTDLPTPTPQIRPDPLAGARESDRLSPGAFFAHHKAMVDDRRDQLARVGMDARHVEALRMPERHEAPPVVSASVALPWDAPADAPRRKPDPATMRGDLLE